MEYVKDGDMVLKCVIPVVLGQ